MATETGVQRRWAWKMFSHVERFGLLCVHRLPRDHPARNEMAASILKAAGKTHWLERLCARHRLVFVEEDGLRLIKTQGATDDSE